MRFLLSRKWLGFLAAVVLLTLLAVRLGEWQFHRLDDRRARNATTERNITRLPSPVEDVLAPGRAVAKGQEWRRVSATGTWDEDDTVVVRYRTRDGQPGVEVVTPLRTDGAGGPALLVDRGWLAAQNSGATRPRLPDPGAGQVTVTGYVRADATGDSTQVDDLSTRAISSREIAGVLPYPVYGGFVMLTRQSPPPAVALGGPELPELDDGPHFFYGLQWWFFGALAVAGFGYLVWDEARRRRDERDAEGADGTDPRDGTDDTEPDPDDRVAADHQ